ncbi:probable membrane-associated kinase regulator 4 [Phoenix dactylifera]|uniref:Probable membrane-associated kinase regulator 4 n=1 Tax=Phoenix dactylifera TaxID=42345 RepID=A0A8B7CBB9_PHODC|nr:probable membrane-associated kinase regulator 4 [Phoenix dactylifera]
MAKSLPPCDHLVEEDYIDMDIGSATFLCYTISSPPHSKEFEFQMSANPRDRESTTFPADELFYKGKLLPLHLPPRLQMVRKLLQSSTSPPHGKPPDAFEEKMATTPCTAASTPSEKCCSISPATSCHVSGELNSEGSLSECSIGLVQSNPKKSWSKRLKLIGQSSLGLKLKASRAYLKSFFAKSDCSDESKECSNGYAKAGKKKPFGQIQRERCYLVGDKGAATLMRSIDGGKQNEEEWSHRKSFSGIIKWNSTAKSSSASSSCSSSFSNASSNGYHLQPQILKRSSSVNSEVESSIQGAIAYCRKSQQLACARKSASDVCS